MYSLMEMHKVLLKFVSETFSNYLLYEKTNEEQLLS